MAACTIVTMMSMHILRKNFIEASLFNSERRSGFCNNNKTIDWPLRLVQETLSFSSRDDVA